VLGKWFGRTIIHSDRRFSYEEAQSIIETGEGDMKEEVLQLYKLGGFSEISVLVLGASLSNEWRLSFIWMKRGNPSACTSKRQKS
jgi:ribonuclease R